MKIEGSVALVAGGASGLGLATTRQLLAAGATTVLLDLPGSAGEQVAEELGSDVVFAPADVTAPAGATGGLDVADRLGPLRITVNCAGISIASRVLGRNGVFPLDAF